MHNNILYHIAGICLLLFFSFFFSGSETALFSLSSFKVKKLQQERGSRGALIARLLGNPRQLLVSILIGNMFVNILSSILAESFISSRIQGGRGTFLSILIMTFAILVVGEITPKTIAIQYAERVSLLVSPVINIICGAISPIRRVVSSISNAIIALFSRGLKPTEHAITEDEIKTAIRVGHREGVVDRQEKDMIQGVFGFAGKAVVEIMRPRNEIVAFEINQPLRDIEETIGAHEYSRIPMYEKEFDNIIGILYAKDLLRCASREQSINVREILRPAYFVPEAKPASSLFRDFRRRKIHMAIVVDEYGGVAGLITLEDLLEEIIGEIRDKGETAPLYRKIGPRSFRIKARMEIDEFNELLDADIRDESSVTIGGFLIGRIGSIPLPGDEHRFGDLVFTIVAAEKHRIDEIVVQREQRKQDKHR